MNVDLFVLALVAFFALVGAFTGAAKQVSRLAAVIAAGLIARLGGPLLGPLAASELKTSPTAGLVVASLALFFLVFLVTRWALHEILLRVLAGREMKDRGLDRSLGFVLGGLRVAAICWFVLCGLAFLEDNVVVAGQKVAVAPQQSVLFQLARNHNLFAMAKVPGIDELVAAARATKSPGYSTLRKDPRFRRATDDDAVKRALEAGDYRALLQNADVLKMLQDPAMRQQLDAAVEASERQ